MRISAVLGQFPRHRLAQMKRKRGKEENKFLFMIPNEYGRIDLFIWYTPFRIEIVDRNTLRNDIKA